MTAPARARALVETLAARFPETQRLRRLPDESVADLEAAGLFRLLQPARWGGGEGDLRGFFDAQMTLAEGCPSTAWVMGVVAVHAWQLALFPERAQEDVWGEDPAARIASSYAPTGEVSRVEGGFHVRGRWSFSSGCDHCGWIFLGGFAPGETREMRTFLLPRADWRIEDNWRVVGLEGTGSKDVIVEGAFVPEHRTHRLVDGYTGRSPGLALNTAPLYRLPFGQVFVRSVSTTAIGILQGALDAYIGVARARIAAFDASKVSLDPTSQRVCAEARATLDEVKAVLYRSLDEMMFLATAGARIPVERRALFRYESARAVVRCAAAVDALFTTSGGRAIFQESPIQRFFQDAHGARAHYANRVEKPAQNLGGLLLGAANTDFFI